MKKIISILVLLIALIFTGMQSVNAQTYFKITVDQCMDNCSTQEDCIYRFEYVVFDTCSQHPEIPFCSGYEDVDCEDLTYSVDIECPDCDPATHDPCFLIVASVKKTCISPGGNYIICEGSAYKYETCENLLNPTYVNVPVPWNY